MSLSSAMFVLNLAPLGLKGGCCQLWGGKEREKD